MLEFQIEIHSDQTLTLNFKCLMMYRIIGAVLIIVGLYLVLWGKSEEKKFASQERARIQSTPEHGNTRTTTHIKASLTQPLLPPLTENV